MSDRGIHFALAIWALTTAGLIAMAILDTPGLAVGTCGDGQAIARKDGQGGGS